jgi:hypothetical protein
VGVGRADDEINADELTPRLDDIDAGIDELAIRTLELREEAWALDELTSKPHRRSDKKAPAPL